MPDKITILYVDDEPDNLVGFKASLRLHYKVLTAVNIPQAISCLNNHPDIKVVFCDQRMPGRTGVDFFEEIRISHPLPVRILITAYTDVTAIIDAINKGNIFRYIKKPWTEFDLISAIDEAYKFYMTNSMLSVRNEELQKAYNELSKFAYSVSHDIRGPLSAISGAINIAREIDSIEEMKEMLYLMEKSVKKLETYILNMHDYYNLQRGELKVTEIDFVTILEELKALYGVTAKVHNVAFNANISQDEIFRNDITAIRLIINNLVSNAFKYQDPKSKNRSVEIDIEVKKSKAIIYVKDTGVGILGSHVSEIFKLFYRSNSIHGGSGLGLYNVKNALLKLNGKIEVTSALHQGTTFKVTIPSI
ncbi:MAG: hybrid sensor histidine kinase/response regulator [Mucilaginibacter sp.]